jgi:hypothetical protein
VIIYRKSAPLRIKRSAFPAPPYWYASALAPYGPRRAAPVAIDYVELRATGAGRMEVAVTENPSDEMERGGWRQRMDAPVLIDAAESAETVFRRGEEILARAHDAGLTAIHLISTRGSLPQSPVPRTTVAIAAWPLDLPALERLFAEAREQSLDWGVVVPVMYPATTNLDELARLAEVARQYRAHYLAALPVETDATARQALAHLTAEDDETYAMLFHSDLEPVHIATERHIAALAHEIGAADFIVPPAFGEKSNWNAATMLTLAATRMLAMDYEVELAGTLARSARVIVDLDKPLTRIAEAASIAIVEAIDEVSVDILTEWLETGQASFVERVNDRWRMRRDAGV